MSYKKLVEIKLKRLSEKELREEYIRALKYERMMILLMGTGIFGIMGVVILLYASYKWKLLGLIFIALIGFVLYRAKVFSDEIEANK